MQDDFSNLVKEKSEDRAAVNNLTASNCTLIDQVALYANRLSAKEAESNALQREVKKLQR